MRRSAPWIAAAAIAALLLLAVSLYLHLWGGVALLAVAGGIFAWYRTQVQRGEDTEQFFGDFGDETRLTGFQAGSPSEMPVDPVRPPAPPREPPTGA
jgi:hypothetical protein